MKRTQMLITQKVRNALPALYSQDGKGAETCFPLRLFHNSAPMTWYISEFDGDDTFFGVAQINGHEWEWGYVSLSELMSLKMRLGTMSLNIAGVERDTSHNIKATMADIKELAGFQERLGYNEPKSEECEPPQGEEETQAEVDAVKAFNATAQGASVLFAFMF